LLHGKIHQKTSSIDNPSFTESLPLVFHHKRFHDMCYACGKVALLLVCIAATVDAQVKCNPVSFTVTGGWCKDKAVSYKGCFDAAAPDTDKSSKAAFITANQALFAPYSQAMCLADATVLCGAVGGKPKDWDCKDVNNECSSDNLPNNYGVGACSTDAQCTAFAKSTMEICCDVIKKYMTDLICDNADKTKIDALFVDGNYLCVLTLHVCGATQLT
jgi:hypothetical protein